MGEAEKFGLQTQEWREGKGMEAECTAAKSRREKRGDEEERQESRRYKDNRMLCLPDLASKKSMAVDND